VSRKPGSPDVTAGTFAPSCSWQAVARYTKHGACRILATQQGSSSMAEQQQYDDNVVKFSVENGQQPGTYELYIKTKSEEFDFQINAEMLQQLGDAIYAAIDKNEGKQ
jgi:hypothetical protein